MNKPLTDKQKERLNILEPKLEDTFRRRDYQSAKSLVLDIQNILRPTKHFVRLCQSKNKVFELAIDCLKSNREVLSFTTMANPYNRPIKPYKPRRPYTARNPYSNRRRWEEIQRINQELKDSGKWNKNHEAAGKIIGCVVVLLIILLIFAVFGINGLIHAFGGPKNLFDD